MRVSATTLRTARVTRAVPGSASGHVSLYMSGAVSGSPVAASTSIALALVPSTATAAAAARTSAGRPSSSFQSAADQAAGQSRAASAGHGALASASTAPRPSTAVTRAPLVPKSRPSVTLLPDAAPLRNSTAQATLSAMIAEHK